MTDRFPPLDQDARTYLVVAPDYADSKRLELRPQHFAEIKHGFASGHFLAGGATLDEQGSGMTGSFMIVKAPNAEAVRKICESDVYATGGAWDLSKLQITEIKMASFPDLAQPKLF